MERMHPTSTCNHPIRSFGDMVESVYESCEECPWDDYKESDGKSESRRVVNPFAHPTAMTMYLVRKWNEEAECMPLGGKEGFGKEDFRLVHDVTGSRLMLRNLVDGDPRVVAFNARTHSRKIC